MPRVYNYIFNELVSDEFDFVGYVAYSLYKSDKIKFIESFKMNHGGMAPSSEDLKPFHDELCNPEMVDRYKKRAREITSSFLSTVLSEKSEEIEQDYITDWKNYIKGKLGPNAPKKKDAQLRKLANDIKETEDIKKAEDESEKQFDRKMLSFLSHNIKNDMQNMSAVILNHGNEIPDSVKRKMQMHFDSIEGTLRNFNKANSDKGFSVSGVMEVLEKLMEDDSRKISTSYHCETAAEKVIKGSSRSMIQVLMNLMKNAIDAVGEADNPKIEVVAEAKEGRCLFHVKDNGCGIAAEHFSKLFDFGFTTKPNGSGSGLCYVKKEIEDNFGGRVRVNEYKEKGYSTIFTIEIPIR